MSIIKLSQAFQAFANWISADVRSYMGDQVSICVDAVADVQNNDFESARWIFVKGNGAIYRIDLTSSAADNGDTVLRDNVGHRYIKATSPVGIPFNDSGTLANRATHDGAAKGYVYAVTDGADLVIYIKESATSGDWSNGFTWRGPIGADGTPGSSNVVGTSTTSRAIGTGSKTFTIVESARGWGVGARLRVSSDANGANFMEGVVTSYSANTLIVSVDAIGGSGTKTDWTINLTGQPGAVSSVNGGTGAVTVEGIVHAASAKTTLVDADELGVADSAAGFVLKKWTFANLKANVLAYFNSVNDGSPLDADRVWTGDSVNSFTPIYSTWAQIKAFLKTYFDTLYPSLDVVVETPQGRVTLTTLTAITATDVAGATTIYYTPAAGNIVPIWNGTRFINTPFTELSLALDPTGAHTGYHQSGKIFDLFVINDAGTIRLVTGPAWASDTSRGTGAGTTERQLLNGIWVNKNALAAARWGSASGNTVAVAANQATYVGCFCASADGQASDTLLKRHLNNAYNKVQRPMARVDGSTGVIYSAFVYRQANAVAGAANQLDFLSGDDGQYVEADTAAAAINGTATRRLVYAGIGLDSTTVNTATLADAVGVDNTTYCMVTAKWRGYPGLGRHKLVWLEAGAGADTQTWSYASAVPYLGMSGWVMG
jgi:hypothetical protein